MKILICGAGISGLLNAIAIKKLAGITPVVIDKRTAFDDATGSVELSPNTQQILQDLGLYYAIEREASEIESIRLSDGIDDKLATESDMRLYGVRYGYSHRILPYMDFIRILIEECDKHDIPLYWGVELVKAQQTDDSVQVDLKTDDDQNKFGLRNFDLVLGADGAYSRVRKDIVKGKTRKQMNAPCMAHYRAEIHDKSLVEAPMTKTVSYWRFAHSHIVMYPSPDGKHVQMQAFCDFDADIDDSANSFRIDNIRELIERLGPTTDWMKNAISTAVDAHKNTLPFLSSSLVKLGASPRIGFVGDAAIATWPHFGQDVGTAAEDALVFAYCLECYTNPNTALALYKQKRQDRHKQVNKQLLSAFKVLRTGPSFRLAKRYGRKLLSAIDYNYSFLGKHSGLMSYDVVRVARDTPKQSHRQ